MVSLNAVLQKRKKQRKLPELQSTSSFKYTADSPAAKGRRRVDAALGDLAQVCVRLLCVVVAFF